MRVTSQLWVDAYLRIISAEGNYACIIKRGAREAGAIFVILNHLDGSFSLFGPAPQAVFQENSSSDRLFFQVIEKQSEELVLAKLEQEKNFDPDLWIVENEDRLGRAFLELFEEKDDINTKGAWYEV
jgi:hypothetical protein